MLVCLRHDGHHGRDCRLRISAVVDDIRQRYGFSMVTLATQLGGVGKTLVGRRSAGMSE